MKMILGLCSVIGELKANAPVFLIILRECTWAQVKLRCGVCCNSFEAQVFKDEFGAESTLFDPLLTVHSGKQVQWI